MRVTCPRCGAQHDLDERENRGPQVEFRCWMCGSTSTAELPQPAAVAPTQFLKPPATPPRLDTVVSTLQGLVLPKGKTITISVLQGPSQGLAHRLTRPLVTIGRREGEADLGIDDPEVSRMHCAVEVKNDLVVLYDLRSTNGTFIEDKPIIAARVGHNSEFRIGSSLLRISIA